MAIDDKYLWQDNTRIKWEDIKFIQLPEYGGYLMEACEENHILSKNDFEYLFKKCFFKTVDYRDQTEVTAKYDNLYKVGYLQWTPDYIYTVDEYTYRNYSSILLNPQDDNMYLYLPIPPELSYYSNQLILEAWSVDYEINGNDNGVLEKSDIQNIDLVDIYGEVYPINTITSKDQDSQLRIKLYWHNDNSNIRFFVNYITFKINKAYDSHSMAIVSIKDNYNLVRFRAQESNKIYEYICQDELANMNGKLYLGDIVFAQFDKYFYNWNNFDWNPALDLFFSTVSGDKNTTAKTEIISYNSDIDLTEDSQTLVSRMSKLQTIPNLLINDKRIMKIRTINENKTQNDKDGFNVTGLKINGVENNYRFGAFPDIFPVHFVSIYGKDYKDNWKITYKDKKLSFEKDSVVTTMLDFDIDQDVLIAYRTENDGCEIINHYQIDYLWPVEGEPNFIQFDHITDFNITNYKKLLEEYKDVLESWPNVDNCIPTIKLKTKTVPYKVTINSDGSLINNSTQIKNEWVESILTTPTSTEETIELANVNSSAGNERNGCYIGSSRTEPIKEGIPINIKITGRRILNNLKSEFTNTSTSSDNKEVSGDVYCDTSSGNIAVGVYLNLTGKIRGLHGCFPDRLFFPVIKSYANYYNNNVDTDNDGITQEDIDKYGFPNYDGNEKYPFYNYLYAAGRGYFKFGLERKTNGEPTNSLYWYDYVIWKNAKSLLS